MTHTHTARPQEDADNDDNVYLIELSATKYGFSQSGRIWAWETFENKGKKKKKKNNNVGGVEGQNRGRRHLWPAEPDWKFALDVQPSALCWQECVKTVARIDRNSKSVCLVGEWRRRLILD